MYFLTTCTASPLFRSAWDCYNISRLSHHYFSSIGCVLYPFLSHWWDQPCTSEVGRLHFFQSGYFLFSQFCSYAIALHTNNFGELLILHLASRKWGKLKPKKLWIFPHAIHVACLLFFSFPLCFGDCNKDKRYIHNLLYFTYSLR